MQGLHPNNAHEHTTNNYPTETTENKENQKKDELLWIQQTGEEFPVVEACDYNPENQRGITVFIHANEREN